MTNTTQLLIDLFGGVSAFSRAVNRTPSTVQYWRDQGRIPQKNKSEVVAALCKHAPAVVDHAIMGESIEL